MRRRGVRRPGMRPDGKQGGDRRLLEIARVAEAYGRLHGLGVRTAEKEQAICVMVARKDGRLLLEWTPGDGWWRSAIDGLVGQTFDPAVVIAISLNEQDDTRA